MTVMGTEYSPAKSKLKWSMQVRMYLNCVDEFDCLVSVTPRRSAQLCITRLARVHKAAQYDEASHFLNQNTYSELYITY